MSTEKIHAVDGTLAFEVGPNSDQVGVRVTTHLPAGEGSLSVPLDGDATRDMAAAMLATLATSRHAARPAAQGGPAASPVGVGTSDAANGAQGGAGGLGDAIRDFVSNGNLNRHADGYLRDVALKVDAQERELTEVRTAVADLCWKATQYGTTEDGDTLAYILPKGTLHRLVGVMEQIGRPVALRAPGAALGDAQ